MPSIVSVGLLGFGLSGSVFHAPLITADPRFRLVKIMERRGEAVRARYPWVEVARDPESIVEDPRLDLVVIGTPNPTHYELALSALRSGKHVVLEKPMTPSSRQADDLIAAAKACGRILTVFHNRRWDGDYQTVRRVVQSGLLGDLAEYQAHYERYRPHAADGWRETGEPGSGLLYDLGSHLIDQALLLFGWPDRLGADLRIRQKGGKADDFFEVRLDYAGFRVILGGSLLVRNPGPRFAVHGRLGSFVKYGTDPQEEALKRGLQPGAPDWGREDPSCWGRIDTEWKGLHVAGRVETFPGAYERFYDSLYEAIALGKPSAVKPEEARDVVRLIELARQSDQEGTTLDLRAHALGKASS